MIDDLYPIGYGGNLEVTVTEADGRKKTFVVPYASMPQLLRPGRTQYSITGGTLRDVSLTNYTPKLFQGTIQHGITNHLTGYGGVQASDKYLAWLGGAAFGSSIGAVALDVTTAHAQMPAQTFTGSSARVSYSKYFQATQSNFSIAAYRFSSNGFMDFNNAARTIAAQRQYLRDDTLQHAQSRLSLSFNQTLGDTGGQLFVSGYTQNYWNQTQRDLQYQVGYSNRWRAVSYSASINRVRNDNGRMENQYMLNLSMPLGKKVQAPQLSVNMAKQSGWGLTTQATVSGIAGSHQQFSYGVTTTHSGKADTAGSLTGQYVSPITTVQATYGQGVGRSSSVELSGMVVAHPDDVTLSPYTGNTEPVNKIVKIPISTVP